MEYNEVEDCFVIQDELITKPDSLGEQMRQIFVELIDDSLEIPMYIERTIPLEASLVEIDTGTHLVKKMLCDFLQTDADNYLLMYLEFFKFKEESNGQDN